MVKRLNYDGDAVGRGEAPYAKAENAHYFVREVLQYGRPPVLLV